MSWQVLVDLQEADKRRNVKFHRRELFEDLELKIVFFSDLLHLVAQKAALLLCDKLKDSAISILSEFV